MKISTCVATYNGEQFIHAQLSSILTQLGPNDEVIVSDDGSTDKTLEIIKNLQDSRIKILQHVPVSKSNSAHIRISKNFENALRNTSGDIIFLSDQDDIWLPNKISIYTEALKTHTLVCGDAYLINSAGDANNTFYAKKSPITGVTQKLIKINYHGCTMAFRRELLHAALPFPKKLPIHDGWLGLIAELTGSACYIPSALTSYRLHGHNSSNIRNSIFYKLSYRYYVFWELYKRYVSLEPRGSLVKFMKLLNNTKPIE